MRNFGRSIGSKGWISEIRLLFGLGNVCLRLDSVEAAGASSFQCCFRGILVLGTANLELTLRRGIQLFN